MERFTTLEPVRLYAQNATGHLFSAPLANQRFAGPRTSSGALPTELHYLVLSYVSVTDIATYSRCSHATAAIAQAERLWEPRWKALHVETVPSAMSWTTWKTACAARPPPRRRPRLLRSQWTDEFGDFASGNGGFDAPAEEMGDFVGAFGGVSMSPNTPLIIYRPRKLQQAKLLRMLASYLSPVVNPLHNWESLYSSLRLAIDRFDANLLSAFDAGMREAAECSWAIYDETRDFLRLGKWNALDNLTTPASFDAMDAFMTFILTAIGEHGSRAARVFPPESEVGEYVTELLTRARDFSLDTYLKAAAATFRESWRMVDNLSEAANARPESVPPRTKVEDVVYQMFEINMDEYLDDEIESVKLAFEVICKDWSKQVHRSSRSRSGLAEPSFLGSHNPAQMKRNVLASFTDVLLLPVTIVPRTMGAVGGAIMTGGSAAVQGIAMLNPQSKNLEKEPESTVFEIGDEFDDGMRRRRSTATAVSVASSTTTLAGPAPAQAVNQFELLLSLDVALQLIHADREALKRAETFAGYPGHYGHRVRDTIEEIFVLLLQALSEKHVTPGFGLAIEHMLAYKPAEHEETTSVAPLLQFFELVHIGDTMQSMLQVYFDKEMAPHIDRTDFLNPVVREKKRFENALDDSVRPAECGTDVLMNQVEHIILTLTQPREYYPPEDGDLELGPTKACTEAINTSKEVLEVFYQEVGIRLIAILQKHIKRQIISLSGGFQVIADLNTYHNFIVSLKVPSITAEFSHLKMLGHVYVVEDAKDLAQIVRDVTRYGGAYRPEDVYEFIQRRSDWKKIEKAVDKTMYNLSFKEDCVIC
ncbi:exocyst complex component Sec10-domain-containing protein [Schizophyllum amplum]|uniref:Exocyst complex component Sec10-domain-containing protein n=1 Tax=Schizophyllum amplum TaxID=97359 RepID=A0A550CBX9_9AGAR|nr:exocyst complex component Sec10-domain-containing protein [Auriculariopsis ampla]